MSSESLKLPVQDQPVTGKQLLKAAALAAAIGIVAGASFLEIADRFGKAYEQAHKK